MDKQQFTNLLKGVKAAYPNFKGIDAEEGLNMWYAMLCDIPYEILSLAIQKHIATSIYPPSISEIRQLASNPIGNKDWSEAWGIVIHSIRNFGFYRSDEALEYIKSQDELAYKVITRLANFRDICQSEDITYHRANFRMAYENTQRRESELRALPPNVKKGISELQSIQAKQQLNTPKAKELPIVEKSIGESMPEDIKERLSKLYGKQKAEHETKEDLEELEKKKEIVRKQLEEIAGVTK